MTDFDINVRHFYARYGHTMHEIQILENGLLEFHALHEYLNKNLSHEEYYLILGNPNKLTLGGLSGLIKTKYNVSTEIKDQLDKANLHRIFLAHRFWWERDIDFENVKSLEDLHLEFTMYDNLFELLFEYFHNETIKLREQNNLHIEQDCGLTDWKTRKAYINNLKKGS